MEVPFTRPYSPRGRGRRRRRGDRLRLGLAGPARARVRGRRSPSASARPTRSPSTNCTTALQLALYVVGRRPRRRGDRPVDVVHRDGQRGLAVRRDAGLRRRRPAHVQPRPGRRPSAPSPSARRRSCRCTSSACRPTWTRSLALAERHGVALVEDAACAIGAQLQGPADRRAWAARVLLAAPAQGDHHRRGRHDHAAGPRGRRRGCGSCASTRWTSRTSPATARATWSSSPIPSAAGTTA